MNTVLIELNSYTQEIRFFVNGVQTDPYSALTNFTYAQVLQNPLEVLDAVSRELNDNFDLEVTASEWEYKKIEDVAFDFADCNSCAARESVISLTSRQRAEKLGAFLPEQTISVLTSGSFLPQPRTYGTITLRATQDPGEATCTTLAKEREVLDAAEALLVNPAIGAAAREAAKQNASYAVCYSLSPVITASFPKFIQADEEAEVIVSSFPEGQAVPPVTVRSSNPDVIFVNGTTLRAVNTGMTNIQVFVQGENVPFHSQKVRVEKNVCVTRIEVTNLEGALPEGKALILDMQIFPHDAEDADQLVFTTSDPSVAEFYGRDLVLKGAGNCLVEISGRKVHFSNPITVSPKLREYVLSVQDVELNLGQKCPVSVRCVPDVCHNAAHTWATSDKTVAVVLVGDDGAEYIKAVGMGRCILTCRSNDPSVKATCTVSVKSAMYQKKSLFDFKKQAVSLFGSAKKMIQEVSDRTGDAIAKRSAPLDAFADLEYHFVGPNGSGMVVLDNDSQEPFLKACSFTASPSHNLRNGQKVTILVSTQSAQSRYPGYTVAETSKTVTVSGLMDVIDS